LLIKEDNKTGMCLKITPAVMFYNMMYHDLVIHIRIVVYYSLIN